MYYETIDFRFQDPLRPTLTESFSPKMTNDKVHRKKN